MDNAIITYGRDTTPDFDVGTVATYVCQPGFRLVGVTTRLCQTNRTFSGEEPMCSKYTSLEKLVTLAILYHCFFVYRQLPKLSKRLGYKRKENPLEKQYFPLE